MEVETGMLTVEAVVIKMAVCGREWGREWKFGREKTVCVHIGKCLSVCHYLSLYEEELNNSLSLSPPPTLKKINEFQKQNLNCQYHLGKVVVISDMDTLLACWQ